MLLTGAVNIWFIGIHTLGITICILLNRGYLARGEPQGANSDWCR